MASFISDRLQKKTWFPWMVWGLAGAFFFFDYVARVSTSVMAESLLHDFGVSAFGLGSLSAFFYYPYVIMQIPVGLIVDRHSIHRILTFMSLLAGVSCYLFSIAQVIFAAEVARFMLGFAASFAFVSTIKLAAEWFPLSRLGYLAGLTQALGMLGAYFGEGPMSYSVNSIGWRASLVWLSVVFFVLAVVIYLFVRDRPPGAKPKHLSRQELGNVFTSLWQVLKTPQSILVGFYVAFLYGPTGSFGELWGINYLMYTNNLSHSAASNANGMIFLGWAVSGPIIGWLSDHFGLRRPFLIISGFSSVIILSIIIFSHNLSTNLLFFLLFIYGMSNFGVSIAYAVAAEIQSKELAGVTLAFTNMMSIIIATILQPLLGLLMDFIAGGRMENGLPVYTANDYHLTMLILPGFLLISLCIALFIKETGTKTAEF